MDLNILRNRMKENRDKTEDIAKMIGLSRTQFSKKLNGKSFFKASDILFFEQRYNLTPEEVFFAFVDETEYEPEIHVSTGFSAFEKKEAEEKNKKIRKRNLLKKKSVYNSYLQFVEESKTETQNQSEKDYSKYKYKTKLIAENINTGEVLKFPTFGAASDKFYQPNHVIQQRVESGKEIGGIYGAGWTIRYATEDERSEEVESESANPKTETRDFLLIAFHKGEDGKTEEIKFKRLAEAEKKFLVSRKLLNNRIKTGDEIGGTFGKGWTIRYATEEDNKPDT